MLKTRFCSNCEFQTIQRCLWSALLVCGSFGSGQGGELITNGGFEDGSLLGWSTASRNSFGAFAVDDDTLSDLSGNSTVGPAVGSYFALSDAVWSGAQVLWQPVTIPPGSSVTISYRLFANSYAPITVGGANLDDTGSANQHARVDLVPLDGFLANPYSTVNAINIWSGGGYVAQNASPTSYILQVHEVTNIGRDGGTYVLRFGVVANQDVFNLGLDSVSVIYTEVPETGASASVALGFLLLFGVSQRRRILTSLSVSR